MSWKRVDEEGKSEDVDVVEDLGAEVVIQYKGRGDTIVKRKVAKESAKQRYCKDDAEVAAWREVCKQRKIEVLREKIRGLNVRLEEAERELEKITME